MPPNEDRSPSTTYTGLRKNRFSLKWKAAPVTLMADAAGVHDERLPVGVDAPAAPPAPIYVENTADA